VRLPGAHERGYQAVVAHCSALGAALDAFKPSQTEFEERWRLLDGGPHGAVRRGSWVLCAIPAVNMICGCPFVLSRGYFKVVVARNCARQTCANLGDLCRALELVSSWSQIRRV
jgi:hypothetical protein